MAGDPCSIECGRVIDPRSDISVAIAIYNGSQFLHEQIQSIAEQTVKPAEILVFDDGSTIEELARTREVLSHFPAVRFHSCANVGIAANFERAIRACAQPFVAPCDQDDIWLPDHLSALRQAIGNSDLCYSDMVFMSADGQVSNKRLSDRIVGMGLESDVPLIFPTLLHGSIVWGASALVRRSLLDGGSIPDTLRFHDWWLSVLALVGNGIRYVDRPLTWHRMHQGNSSAVAHATSGEESGRLEARRRASRGRAESAVQCLIALKAARLPLSRPQQRMLDQTIDYYQARLSGGYRLARTLYAFRHRQEMFPLVGSAGKLAYALAESLR
jgi:glycosyltransferase involved in cell wall biosynthesis